jgi:hypothetical protein
LWAIDYAAKYLLRFDSVHHSPNTHLTGEALGLLYVAHTFPMLRIAERAHAFAIDTLQAEVPHQFLADGLHYERATGYHRYHIEFYLHATAIARAEGASWADVWREPLRRALDACQSLRRPYGRWPVLGDEDGGAALRLWAGPNTDQAPLLALGAALLDEPRWMRGLDEESGSLTWWFGLTPHAPDNGALPARIDLPDAGYFGARTADGWYALVDAGPHGGERTGHAHTDLGHVEVCWGDAPIVIDPGSLVYGFNPGRRDADRSPEVHATVTIPGRPLAVPSHPFGWKRVAPAPQVERGDVDDGWAIRLWYSVPGGPPVTHERHVVVVPQVGVVIVDLLLGKGRSPACWHLPVGDDVGAAVGDLGGAHGTLRVGPAVVQWAHPPGTSVRLLAVDRAPSYGVAVPAHRVEWMAPVSTELPAIGTTAVTVPGVGLVTEAEGGGARVYLTGADIAVLVQPGRLAVVSRQPTFPASHPP